MEYVYCFRGVYGRERYRLSEWLPLENMPEYAEPDIEDISEVSVYDTDGTPRIHYTREEDGSYTPNAFNGDTFKSLENYIKEVYYRLSHGDNIILPVVGNVYTFTGTDDVYGVPITAYTGKQFLVDYVSMAGYTVRVYGRFPDTVGNSNYVIYSKDLG